MRMGGSLMLPVFQDLFHHTSPPFLLGYHQRPQQPASRLPMDVPVDVPDLTLFPPFPALLNSCASLKFTVSHEQSPCVPNFLSERSHHLLDLNTFCPLVKQLLLQASLVAVSSLTLHRTEHLRMMELPPFPTVFFSYFKNPSCLETYH